MYLFTLCQILYLRAFICLKYFKYKKWKKCKKTKHFLITSIISSSSIYSTRLRFLSNKYVSNYSNKTHLDLHAQYCRVLEWYNLWTNNFNWCELNKLLVFPFLLQFYCCFIYHRWTTEQNTHDYLRLAIQNDKVNQIKLCLLLSNCIIFLFQIIIRA